MPKPKRQKLSKEQLAQQLKLTQEAEFFKKLVREKVYPILQKAKSPVHAQQICDIFKTVMNGQMNQYWAERNVSDLGLAEELTKEKDVPNVEMYKGLIEALSELKITDALKLLQGMTAAIDGYARKLATEKPMSDVPISEILND